jgi:hypothetical protein
VPGTSDIGELPSTLCKSVENAVDNRVAHWQVTMKLGFTLDD